MSNKPQHVILCQGAEINMADMMGLQELLQETHGFAKYYYDTNRSAKYLKVTLNFFSDSRDNDVYNIGYEVRTNPSSTNHILFVSAPKTEGIFDNYSSWVDECGTKGWTYETHEGSVRDAIYEKFPPCEMNEEYRYCSAFLSRWSQIIYGEACGNEQPSEEFLLYVADNFPTASLKADMYAVIGRKAERDSARRLRNPAHSKREDYDALNMMVTANKGEDGYMVAEFHTRKGEMIFRGRIQSQYQLNIILSSLGVAYDW